LRRILKILGYLFLALAALIACGIGYLYIALPKKEPPSLEKIQSTPERLKRGEYLVKHVSSCLHCHSVRDSNAFAYPEIPGTEGQGQIFVEHPNLGRVSAPNITPASLAKWTDGEIVRAMTGGVSKDGRPLFPMMPYLELASMSKEDVNSVIVYLRTLKPIKSNVPATKLKFPLNLIVRTIPHPPQPKTYNLPGGYLAKIAGCEFCHTPEDHNKKIEGKLFAGGLGFEDPGRPNIFSANLTPDPETGIGKWTKEQFVTKFRRFNTPETSNIPIPPGQPNSPMPWVTLSGLTDEDLGLIFDYLRTVPPVHNVVKNGL
jgi:hypothetical protein